MLTEFNLGSFEYICLNMREVDRVEVFGMLHNESPLQLAYEYAHVIRNKGRSRIGWSDRTGKPAAFGALTEDWPGMWSVWMFGTDDFKDCAADLIRWFRREAADILTVCNGRRLQCDSRFDHAEAHKMLKALGAVEEVRLRSYGKDGADYIRFVWFKGENDQVLRPGFTRAA